MIKSKRNEYLILFWAAIGLFVLNNILLGWIVPKLPGGSATGITSMFVLTWISLHFRKFGYIPVIYLIYGLIGLPSHLVVGDKMYFVAILLLAFSALIYDWVLCLKNYKITVCIFAYPLLLILVNASYQFLNFLNSGEWILPNLKAFLLSFPFGYAGILLGYLTFKIHNTAMKRHYQREVKFGLSLNNKRTPEILTETDLAHLPEPVLKYICYSGAIGKPKVHSFKAEFTGKIRKNDQSPWMPFKVEQHSFIEESVRLFWMDAVMMHLPVKGFHCFKRGIAFMDIRLFGLFKVQYMDGKEMRISETVTFFNDLCVMAPATLIDQRIKWIETVENRVLAEFTDNGITISAWLHFGPNGELVNFISDDRYAFKGKNRMEQFRWQTPLRNYQEINGAKISTEAELIYECPEGDFLLWKV